MRVNLDPAQPAASHSPLHSPSLKQPSLILIRIPYWLTKRAGMSPSKLAHKTC